MNISIKYRLYPNEEQKVYFAKTFGCCRKIYNLMLSDKIDLYKTSKTFGRHTPAMYKDSYPYLKEVDSLALANVQMHLQTAFRNCFSKKRKSKNGFPKFKSAKRSRKSYTTNNQNGTVDIGNNCIKLPKVGKVKAVIHRQPEDGWTIKSATISQDSTGSYYASVLFEYEKEIVRISKNSTSAVGLKAMVHKYYRESHKKLAKEQRKLPRKTGYRKKENKSNNYLKQLRKINSIHRHIANQRHDSLHKKSTEIANQYDIVCIEDLNMKAIGNKGFGNGKATFDNGYGMFISMLEYKLKLRGKYLVRIDKWFPSSQICNCCGSIKKLSLNDRVYRCDCGYTGDRDHNAAINILNEGLRILQVS